ncbi:MAG: hypothetical protein AAGA96_15285 [Verrucomicrobiota bacterium]
MKAVQWLIAIIAVSVSSGCRHPEMSEEFAPSRDQNRIALARAVMISEDLEFSEDELIAFDSSARVTEAILTAKIAPPLIEILRPGQPATEVSFEQIEGSIRSGDVVRASQNHTNRVEVLTRDGRRLTSTQPRIDTILELIAEVDPKSLFIEIWTE